LNRKDYGGARASAEKILAQLPGEVRALSVLVQTYVAQGQIPASLQKAREYAAKQPNSDAVQHFLGQLLAANGDKADARRAFEAAKAANPDSVPADLALASMDAAEGRPGDARKRIAALLAAHPDNTNVHILSAQLDMAEGKNAPAIDTYRKALEVDPRNVVALNNLACLLTDAGQPDEALKYAQQAKQITPEAASVDDTLGWTYYTKGIYSLAVTHLENAVTREPNARRQYHLAMAYFKAGDPRRGRRAFDAAAKADPNLPEAQVARQMFAGTSK
jgi:tetratricopeptide (TPR) repeat protein